MRTECMFEFETSLVLKEFRNNKICLSITPRRSLLTVPRLCCSYFFFRASVVAFRAFMWSRFDLIHSFFGASGRLCLTTIFYGYVP